MRYLVLGSRGQIGGSLVPYLRALGHTVDEFDIRDGEQFDLRRRNDLLEDLLTRCDFVFFLAWDVGGSVYLQQYQDTYDFVMNNVSIICNTFDSIRRSGKPFLFASSQMANMSYSTYGVTKHVGEKVAAAMGGLTVKFWNVYGLETDPQKTHVITDFIEKAKTTGRIDMRTDGSEYRQMLYADDCSECLYVLSKKYDQLDKSKEYHVTSFEWVSVMEIAETVASFFPGVVIQPAEAVDSVQKDRRNEPDEWILNFWKPQTKLRDGIRAVIMLMHEKK